MHYDYDSVFVVIVRLCFNFLMFYVLFWKFCTIFVYCISIYIQSSLLLQYEINHSFNITTFTVYVTASCGSLAFNNGREDLNMDTPVNTADDPSTSVKTLVSCNR